MRNEASLKRVSFILPAYNEARYIADCINAIHGAARENNLDYEIIVANDASTDATAAIASERGATVIEVNNRRISTTRNAGAAASRGEWLVFVDADTNINGKTLAGAVQALRNGAAGGGAAFDFDGRLPRFGRLLQWVGRRLYPRAKLASGCFLFCTRDDFNAIGGFATHLAAAEEAKMSRDLGRRGRFVIVPEPVVTSGRKLRAYSTLELLAAIVVAGPLVRRFFEQPEVWYGERRDDPDLTPASTTSVAPDKPS